MVLPQSIYASMVLGRKGNHSSFLAPTVVGGRRPLSSEIYAQNDPLPSKNADFDRFLFITSQS